MSQFLEFFLKRKDNTEISINLGYFTSTLASKFSYQEEYTILKRCRIDDYLELIKEELEDMNNLYNKLIKEKNELLEIIHKCSSYEVINSLLERLADDNSCIEQCEDDINSWKEYLNEFSFISKVARDNEEKWDLYYINC